MICNKRFRAKALSMGLYCALFLAFSAGQTYAQTTSGVILGRVTDPDNAAIPRAIIRAKSETTGFTREVETDLNGLYLLASLSPGIYSVEAAKEGFATTVSRSNKLEIDQKLRLDFKLEIGSVTATVNVIGSKTPLLQIRTSEVGQVIENKSILDLPLSGREFLDLVRLTTNVTSAAPGAVNNLNIAINGQREYGNSIVFDGIETVGNRNNDTTLRPNIDSVQEFKVVTSTYSAEFGRAVGGVIAIQTKSGTNNYHGNAFEFFRPRNTAARSFFSPSRSNLQQNNFGGTIGGPLVKNKTFFFASYDGLRQVDVVSFLDSVPPLDQIRFLPNGAVDLSGLKDPITGKQIPIFDPNFYAVNFTSQQFPNNIIPANRVSPAGLAILQKFFPRPTQTGILNGYFNNFISRQAINFNTDAVDTRIDHALSEKDSLSGVYHYFSFDFMQGDRYAGQIPTAGGGDADFGDSQNSRAQSLSITETHLFSDKLVNEFRFGYTRSRLDQFSLLNSSEALATQTGVRNINLPGFPQTAGFPNIFLGTGFSTGGSTFKPLFFLDSNYQLTNNLSGVIGQHNWKIGAEVRFLSSRPNFSLFPTGFFFFGGSGSSLTSDPNFDFFDQNAFYQNGGSDIADLLLGSPLTVNLGLKFTNPKTKSYEIHFYGQDTWQVADRLVLTYGLRYEYQRPYKETDNNASNFDPATLSMMLAGRGSVSETLIGSDRNNFGPRVGFAFRLSDRTVLRAGYGVFYSPENDARSDILTQNYPFLNQQLFFNDVFGGLPFAYSLDAGVPRNTQIPLPDNASSIDLTQIPNSRQQNIFFIDPNLRTGYSQHYNIVLQRQLAQTLSVEIGYVGSTSRKLPYAIGNLNRGNLLSSSLGSVNSQFSIGNSDYNSLQIKADKRFASGISFLIAYTLSKSLDNGPAPFNLTRSPQQPQDPFNLGAERALSANDARHNFVSSFIYDLPIGRKQRFLGKGNSVLTSIVSNWQINGIFRYRSGLPVNVQRNPRRTDFEGLRPNLLGDPNLPDSEQSLDKWFDVGAFSVAGLGQNMPGNAGRNLIRGPRFLNFDFSTFKQFSLDRLREDMELEVRFEFFNLTNTPSFANPITDFTNVGFGRITGVAGNPRIIQFAAKVNF